MKNIFPNSMLLTTQSNVARPITLTANAGCSRDCFWSIKKICVFTWVSLSGHHLLSPKDELSHPLIFPWHSVYNTYGIIFSGLWNYSIKRNKLVLTKVSKHFIETIFKLNIYLCINKSCSLSTFFYLYF